MRQVGATDPTPIEMEGEHLAIGSERIQSHGREYQKNTAITQKTESTPRITMRVRVAIRPTSRMAKASKTIGIEKTAITEARKNKRPNSFILLATSPDER